MHINRRVLSSAFDRGFSRMMPTYSGNTGSYPVMVWPCSNKKYILPKILPQNAGPAPKPYTGPSKEEVAALRHKFLNPALFLYYKSPIMLVEGHGQYLFGTRCPTFA